MQWQWQFLSSAGRLQQPQVPMLRCLAYAVLTPSVTAGSAPIVRSWGAVLAGHVAHRSMPRAAAVLRRFCELGGTPDERMINDIVGLCLQLRDRSYADQVSGCRC